MNASESPLSQRVDFAAVEILNLPNSCVVLHSESKLTKDDPKSMDQARKTKIDGGEME